MKHLPTLKFVVAFLLILFMYQPSFAHKVRIFAWQEGDNIVTESKFSGGRVAQQVTVSVIDMISGEHLLSGTTNTEGVFSFPIPQDGSKELEIIVDGGDGHKNSWKYIIEPSPTTNKSPQPAVMKKPEKKLEVQAATDRPRTTSPQSLDTEELTRLIEAVMDKQLAPIRRSLAENSEQGPTIQDIIGGIGYILGLAGIAAYMQSLRNRKE